MAFAYTVDGMITFGNKKKTFGTFTNGAADSGGNIDTRLAVVESMTLTSSGASVVADSGSVNETLPADGTAITIVTTTGADGFWSAVGHG